MRTRPILIRGFGVYLGVLLASAVAAAGVREVGPITLSVADLDLELGFYTNTLPFRLVRDPDGHVLELHSAHPTPTKHPSGSGIAE